MKKDYTLYVISRIFKGRRSYLVDLDTFSDQFNKAYFFDSKKDAKQWMKSAMTYDPPCKIQPQPTYELLSVTMKINKESCQL
jgi:hypothetical protein